MALIGETIPWKIGKGISLYIGRGLEFILIIKLDILIGESGLRCWQDAP